MNQTEIFQNMTKGEWSIDNTFEWQIYQDGEIVAEAKKDIFINAPKIVSAVNNTYGKGINPEGVEKLLKVVKKLSDLAGEVPYYDPIIDEAFFNEIQAALTAAKL